MWMVADEAHRHAVCRVGACGWWPMRLAYVVSLFPKLSETFILREILELSSRGHEITILSLKRDLEPIIHEDARALIPATVYPRFGAALFGALVFYLVHEPVTLLRIVWTVTRAHLRSPSMLARALAVIPVTLPMAKLLRDRNVEHVHAHWATWPALSAWIISRLNGIPYSVTGHAHDLFLPNPMLTRKVEDALFFATISEFNRALLLRICGPRARERVRLIRCGLPLARFPFDARAGRPSGDPGLVVSVGRLVDYKGFDVLIRACALLRDAGRPVRCRIAGEGPERPRLEELIVALDLGALVELAGGCPQEQVIAMLGRADLFVMASVPGADGQQDGIPIVLMEAMALGVPVVSTRLSGIPELVVDGQTGLLVAPGDAAQLAAAIRRLLDDSRLAASLAAGARLLVEKQYDLAGSVTQLSAAFSEGR